MSRLEEQRLMTRVARLYYERGLCQTEIVKRLVDADCFQIPKQTDYPA